MLILKAKAKSGASEHTAPYMLRGAAQHMEHLSNAYIKETSELALDAATLRTAKTTIVPHSLQQAIERYMHVPMSLGMLLGHHSGGKCRKYHGGATCSRSPDASQRTTTLSVLQRTMHVTLFEKTFQDTQTR